MSVASWRKNKSGSGFQCVVGGGGGVGWEEVREGMGVLFFLVKEKSSEILPNLFGHMCIQIKLVFKE